MECDPGVTLRTVMGDLPTSLPSSMTIAPDGVETARTAPRLAGVTRGPVAGACRRVWFFGTAAGAAVDAGARRAGALDVTGAGCSGPGVGTATSAAADVDAGGAVSPATGGRGGSAPTFAAAVALAGITDGASTGAAGVAPVDTGAITTVSPAPGSTSARPHVT